MYMCRYIINQSVQFSPSVVSIFVTPWTAAHQASLSITNFQSLLKLMSIESVMPSNHLILCCPLLLLSIFPSIRWAKYWSFSFSISASNEYSGLISFKMDFWKAPTVWGCFLWKPRYNQRVGTFSLTPLTSQQERGAEG